MSIKNLFKGGKTSEKKTDSAKSNSKNNPKVVSDSDEVVNFVENEPTTVEEMIEADFTNNVDQGESVDSNDSSDSNNINPWSSANKTFSEPKVDEELLLKEKAEKNLAQQQRAVQLMEVSAGILGVIRRGPRRLSLGDISKMVALSHAHYVVDEVVEEGKVSYLITDNELQVRCPMEDSEYAYQ